MNNNPTLSNQEHNIFDEELAFLAMVESRFSHIHQRMPIESDDPDVKRLIEAMAAFMAKGRMVAKSQIDQLHQRVFQQLLPYMASPVVSMGLFQANSQYITEATQLPQKTLFTLTTEDGDKADFVSLHTMPLRPITISQIQLYGANQGSEPSQNYLSILLTAENGMPGDLQHLPLYLNINNHFALTRQFIDCLASVLDAVTVVFDDGAKQSGRFLFGSCQSTLPDLEPDHLAIDHQFCGLHPVEQIRQFFQLPQQENYLNLYFSNSPQNWRKCEIKLHFHSPWPRTFKLSASFFKLGMICVENKLNEFAEPFRYEATKDSYPLRPPVTHPDFKLVKCLGVYQETAKDKQLLSPGILKSGNGAYEVHMQESALPLLEIQLAEAFLNPVKISAEALWHQPEFTPHLWKKLGVRTTRLAITNLRFHTALTPVPCILQGNHTPQSLLELSLLKNKDVLSLEEILFVLDCLGSVFNREFKGIKILLKQLKVISPTHYHFVVYHTDAQTRALLDCFIAKLAQLLSLWLPVGKIQITLSLDELKNSSTPTQESFRDDDDIPQHAAEVFSKLDTVQQYAVEKSKEPLICAQVNIVFEDETDNEFTFTRAHIDD